MAKGGKPGGGSQTVAILTSVTGIPGPLEQALVGVPVADPANPVEVLRVIHSYDPCLACAVHVCDTAANETFKVHVL